MKGGAAFAALICLCACGGDETLTAFAQDDTVFLLAELDGAPFEAVASIDIGVPGSVTGAGPCNTYSAPQSAPYPWFDLGPIAATRRACPALALESQFFEALGSMTFAEILGDTLILSNEAGSEMVFRTSIVE